MKQDVNIAPNEALVKGELTLNGENHYTGYYNPAVDWNGWICPYFTKMVVMNILDECDVHEWQGEKLIITTWEGYEPEEYTPQTIEHDGQTITVYALGAFFWTWDVWDESTAIY